MPSHRADAAPTKVRRQRSGRTGEMPAVPADADPFPRPATLPPGVIDTRPPGVRVIDIRETAAELGFEAANEAPGRDERPIDTQWVRDRFRAAEGSDTVRGTVPVPEGLEIRNGVLDTRPKGLAFGEDDVEAHFVGSRPSAPALPLFPGVIESTRARSPRDDLGAVARRADDDADLFAPVVEPPAVDRVPARSRRASTASIPVLGRSGVGGSPWVGRSRPSRPAADPLAFLDPPSEPPTGDLVVPEFVPQALVDEAYGVAPQGAASRWGTPVVSPADGITVPAADGYQAFDAYGDFAAQHPGLQAPFASGDDEPLPPRAHRYGSAAGWLAPGAPSFESILGPTAATTAATTAGLSSVEVPVPPAPAARPRAGARATQENSPFVRRSELRKREASRAGRKAPTSSLSVPRVGIASALGLATIAAPLTGVLTMPADVPTLSSTAVIAQAGLFAQPVPVFPQVSVAPVAAVEDARLVTDESLNSAVPEALAAPRTLLVTKPSRSNERSVLPGCTGVIPAGYNNAQNGQLPKPLLCTLWDKDFSLRADAAVAFAKLNVAYNQKFGHNICIVDAYRTLQEQYTIKRLRGGYAATPGTSEHGWGLAVDLCGGSSLGGTPTYTWLRANAPLFGWDNPEWARPGGSGPTEQWHWEFLPGEKVGPGGD